MALPSIKPSTISRYSSSITSELTMYVTLTFICLGHEEIGNMSANMILVADGVTAEYLLQSTEGQYTPSVGI